MLQRPEKFKLRPAGRPVLVRVALVGAGRWGVRLAEKLEETQRFELSVVCDPSDVARTSIRSLGVEHLSELPKADAAIVATPSATHADIAVALIRRGLHVFVEKPLALSTRDAVRVRDEADAADRVVQVGHLLLYHPLVEELRQVVAAGALGRILRVQTQRLATTRPARTESAWWVLGPHDVSLVRYVLGKDPVAVRGRCNGDSSHAVLLFGSEEVASISVSTESDSARRQVRVVGERATAVFDDVGLARLRILSARGSLIGETNCSWSDPLARELIAFADAVQERITPRTDVDEGVAVVRILQAVQRSIESGGELTEVEPTQSLPGVADSAMSG